MARQPRSRSLSYPPTYTYCPRRRRCSKDSLRISQTGTLETFRAAIFKEIKDRLARFGVSTRWYLPQLVTHCLANSVDQRSWDDLLHRPLQVPDNVLKSIFRLHEDLGEDRSTLACLKTTYYVRSFSLSVSQLRDVIADFHENGLYYPKKAVWANMIETMQSSDIVYLRYIGRTDWRTAFQRHREDMLMRSTGFLSKFLISLGHLHPVVIDCSAVYAFSDIKSVYQNSLPLHNWQEAQSFREIREQALIALFGLPSLLNQVIGGSQCEFALSNAHHAMFALLNTDTLLRLAPASFYPVSASTETEIFNWASDIHSYAKDHQVSVSMFRNKQHKFSEALKDTVAK